MNSNSQTVNELAAAASGAWMETGTIPLNIERTTPGLGGDKRNGFCKLHPELCDKGGGSPPQRGQGGVSFSGN